MRKYDQRLFGKFGDSGGYVSAWLLITLCFFVLEMVSGRSAEKPWQDEWDIPSDFSISIAAAGFECPTAIAFVPNPGPERKSPLYYVTEMRGKVKVVTRDRSVLTFGQVPFDLTPVKELPDL